MGTMTSKYGRFFVVSDSIDDAEARRRREGVNGPAVTVDPRIQRTPYLQPAGGVSGCARQTVLFISVLLSGSEPACAPPEVRAAPALAQLNSRCRCRRGRQLDRR